MANNSILFSSSEDYFEAAARELREAFEGASIKRLGPDLGRFEGAGTSLAQVSEAAWSAPLVFVRHLTEEMAHIPTDKAKIEEVSALGVKIAEERVHPGEGISIQCWVSGRSAVGYNSYSLFERISADLAESGFRTARSGFNEVMSVCVNSKGVSIGFAIGRQGLSDWPGGRVRLSKHKALISRAELKLEEAIKVLGVQFPSDGTAVDLGASPGGWTNVLRRSGLEVWAVDPGDIDGRLLGDPRVHHVRTTAGRFFASSDQRFAVVVNDMRMDPRLSCKVMLDAADRLRPGGLAVMTLKLGSSRPFTIVRNSLETLRKQYDVLHARQLQHNRHEITVVCRLRAARTRRASR
ncbi:SAM-dependent methyltransferase [Nocardiopsis dassonvillei]|uniref:SAM-dependent methyltransferase n=1 Tax=Nocardiopsis dassonvillei TaxID=2014 RepID=UPI0033FA1766